MSDNTNKKENKNIKALFSVVCLCIISLGLIVYFSGTGAKSGNTVNENQTLRVTTQPAAEVQHPVTVTETETQKTENTTAAEQPSQKTKKKEESTSFPAGENNVPYKSYYKYPISEAVDKGYTEELVFDETMGDWRAHPAVDFIGNSGDDVTAINDGTVLDVYTDNLLGNVVVIDHGAKLIARYCGLESVCVKKGKTLDIGNKIGTLGKVPSEAEQSLHLHFETKLDGEFVNPMDVMNKTE